LWPPAADWEDVLVTEETVRLAIVDGHPVIALRLLVSLHNDLWLYRPVLAKSVCPLVSGVDNLT
jgi:hypothetical protein